MSADSQHFLNILKSTPAQTEPYHHFLLEDIFDTELIKQLRELPFDAPQNLEYKVGRREEFNSSRQYLNPENLEKYECARRVANVFLSPEVISQFEKEGGVSLGDSLLRIEYTLDTDKFWLEPHTDIGVKNFTMLIYLSDDEDCENWGTDVYMDANTHYGRAPANPGNAIIFFPSPDTWHGFEPRSIKGVRKTLIINYVTQDWRNRHELVHPSKAMSEFLMGAEQAFLKI